MLHNFESLFLFKCRQIFGFNPVGVRVPFLCVNPPLKNSVQMPKLRECNKNVGSVCQILFVADSETFDPELHHFYYNLQLWHLNRVLQGGVHTQEWYPDPNRVETEDLTTFEQKKGFKIIDDQR
jgi:hypothetical protein